MQAIQNLQCREKVNTSIPAKIMASLIFSASNITVDKISSYQATKGLNASFPTTDLVQREPLSV